MSSEGFCLSNTLNEQIHKLVSHLILFHLIYLLKVPPEIL